MRFEVGQKYVSKSDRELFAEVVEIEDEGRAASVQLRNAAGILLKDGGRVVYAQFSDHWSPAT